MRKCNLLTALVLVVGLQTAFAQEAMRVWRGGTFKVFLINEVDEVDFVKLVSEIKLSQSSAALKIGETLQLQAAVLPADASERSVAWGSVDETVATVDQYGRVTAIAEGSCTITCRATDGSGVKAECQVTVTKAGGDTGLLSCPDGNHPHAIDLGLPSGTKWSCCNVGASTPEGYGGYYAWGETSEKSYYSWDTYMYWHDSNGDGFVDSGECTNLGSDIAGTSYDVAHVRMGAPWHMPSTGHQQELIDNCSWQWMQQNGVNGVLVTGSNGGQIFLPAAGFRGNGILKDASSFGYYLSSSLGNNYGGNHAFCLQFYSGYWDWWRVCYRGDAGRSVRAVCP